MCVCAPKIRFERAPQHNIRLPPLPPPPVFTPVSREGTPEANKLWVNELYAGEAAVAAHEATDRMQALLPKLQGLCLSLRLVHGLVAAETLAEKDK